MRICKIAFADDWIEAEKAGAFVGSAKDVEDGFIHFSTAAQLPETLRLHYAQTRKLLVIAAVDSIMLDNSLKWEPSRNGEHFPHLYGHLPMAAVMGTLTTHSSSIVENNYKTVQEFIESRGVFAE